MSSLPTYVLAGGVELVQASELPDEVREQLGAEPDAVAVTRPHHRAGARLVSAVAGRLLEHFKEPTTIAQAVLVFADREDRDREELLTAVWPMLRALAECGFLQLEGDAENDANPKLLLAPGTIVGSFAVRHLLQATFDSEVLQVLDPTGQPAVLKLAKEELAATLLAQEAVVLRVLPPGIGPELLDQGIWEGDPWIAISWCAGREIERAADDLRAIGDLAGIFRLAASLARTYESLWEAGIIHGDIHNGNVLVGRNGKVVLLDFGWGGTRERPPIGSPAPSLNTPPEVAEPALAEARKPLPSAVSERYSVAAMLYRVLAGIGYVDFSLQEDRLLHQICEAPRIGLRARGVSASPELEECVLAHLSVSPDQRPPSFESLTIMLDAAAEQATGRVVSLSGEDEALFDDLEPGGDLAELPTDGPQASLFHGAGGVSLALLGVAVDREDASLLDLSDLWAIRAERAARVEGPSAFLSPQHGLSEQEAGCGNVWHTVHGLVVLRALVHHARCEKDGVAWAVERWLEDNTQDDKRLDLTTGLGGSLLGTLALRELSQDVRLLRRGAAQAATMLNALCELGPVGDKATNLGIAHGWAGWLWVLARWQRQSNQPLSPELLDWARQLAALGEPVERGVRWPWDLASPDTWMAGWCNGSAGYVHLWLTLYRYTKSTQWLDLARAAGWHAWEAPAASGSLCCGDAGRAHALLRLSQVDGADWLRRARFLVNRAIAAPLQEDAAPHSLFQVTWASAGFGTRPRIPSASTFPCWRPG